MPINQNSATRLYNLCKLLRKGNPQSSAAGVWSAVLGLPTSTGLDQIENVTAAISVIQTEVRLLQFQLSQVSSLEPSMYEGILAELRNALQPVYLGGNFASVHSQISERLLATLPFMASSLPDEEDLISEDDFGKIQEAIDEVATHLRSEGIPPALGVMLQRHLDIIRVALVYYPVSGAKGIRLAGATCIGDLILRHNAGQHWEAQPAYESIKKMVVRVVKIAETADKADKVMKLADKAAKTYELIEKFLI
jgi:hypothetical protein